MSWILPLIFAGLLWSNIHQIPFNLFLPLIFLGLLVLGWIGRWLILTLVKVISKDVKHPAFRSPFETLSFPTLVWIALGAILIILKFVELPVSNGETILYWLYRVLYLSLLISIIWTVGELGGALFATFLSKTDPDLASFTFVSTGARILLVLLGAIWLLDGFGISIAPILTALGIGGVGLAFGLQAFVADTAAGLHLILGRQFGVGDKIKLGEGEEGYVQDIGWRNTVILNNRNNHVIIPNKKFFEQVVTVYSKPDSTYELIIPFLVPNDSSPEKVIEVMESELKEIEKIEGVLGDPPPRIRINRLDKHEGVEVNLIVRISSVELEEKIKHEVNQRLWNSLWKKILLPKGTSRT